MSDEKEFPSDKADKFVVRFPEGMRDRIADEAKKNNRSMNAEIVARLEGSFDESSDASRIDELEAIAQQHGTVVKAMEGELSTTKELVDSYRMLLRITGMYLRMTAERVPESTNAISNELMSIMQTMGEAFSSGNLEGAALASQRMVELGIDTKAFEPDGAPSPNHPSRMEPTKGSSYAEYAKEVLETGRAPQPTAIKRIRRTPLKRS